MSDKTRAISIRIKQTVACSSSKLKTLHNIDWTNSKVQSSFLVIGFLDKTNLYPFRRFSVTSPHVEPF